MGSPESHIGLNDWATALTCEIKHDAVESQQPCMPCEQYKAIQNVNRCDNTVNRKPQSERPRLSGIRQPRLLIDGYNLLFAIGFGNIGSPSAVLLSARQELLQFLTQVLDPELRLATVIVFDAKRAPYGAASVCEVDGMSIRFAVDYRDADELLKELIRGHTTPRKLQVVSSDHSIQVAAQRRRATVIDSEAWYEQIRMRSKSSVLSDPACSEQKGRQTGPPARRTTDHHAATAGGDLAKSDDPPALANPFPPNYGQDVAAEFGLSNPFPPGYADDINEQNVDDLSRRGKRKKK